MAAPAKNPPSDSRKRWLSALANAKPQELEAYANGLQLPSYEWMRQPEVGLVMVRGRMGGSGNPFNVGEMTVVRCTIRTTDGVVGVGYVQGRNTRHATLMALFDAALQKDSELLGSVVEPLENERARRRRRVGRKANATKVDFFTLARGGNPDDA